MKEGRSRRRQRCRRKSESSDGEGSFFFFSLMPTEVSDESGCKKKRENSLSVVFFLSSFSLRDVCPGSRWSRNSFVRGRSKGRQIYRARR